MSSTIKTENLKLSQFQNADVPSWRTDYNSDMKKIDSAYAKSISGQDEENDIQNGDYLKFYDVSAEKNKKTLWSNILEKLGSVFSKNSQILSTVEECEASTENNNIAGASAIAELNSSLDFNVGNIISIKNNEINHEYTRIRCGIDGDNIILAVQVENDSITNSDNRTAALQIAFDGVDFKLFALKNGIWTIKKIVLTD